MTRHYLQLALTGLLALAACRTCRGHGTPIAIDAAPSGAIWTTDPLVYISPIEPIGGQVLLTDVPGYRVAAGGQVDAGTRFALETAGSLLYWSPQSQSIEPTRSTFTVANEAGELLTVESCKPLADGSVELGEYSGAPDWHRHVDYLLEPLGSPFGAYAVPLRISAEPLADSAPLLLVFGYYGGSFSEAMMAEAVASLQSAHTTLRGDFDYDCDMTANDIDLLSQSVREAEWSAAFDLSADGQLSDEDRRIWVEQLAATYFGDANLDGQFNSSDLVGVLQAGEYEDGRVGNSGWATGDWSGDGEFATSDLLTAFQSGAYELGPRPAAAVPEPASTKLLAWLIATISAFQLVPRRRNGRRRPSERRRLQSK
jgi:hypothetical protein